MGSHLLTKIIRAVCMQRMDCAAGRKPDRVSELCMMQDLLAQMSSLNTMSDIQWMDGILRKANELSIFLVWFVV